MNTNIAAARYHPRILSSKYGQTGDVKPFTANPQFVVCSKMTKPRYKAGSRVRTTYDWEYIVLVLGSEGLW